MPRKQTRMQRLDTAINESRAASRIVKAKPNAKRSGKAFALDVDGSTCMSDARWSPNGGGTLAITFAKDGSQYLYFGVERSVAKQIDSGEDFNGLIKGQYSYE